jgi:hypothetical protein
VKRLFEIQEFTAALHAANDAANAGFAFATETQTKQAHAVLTCEFFASVQAIRLIQE